MLPQILKDEMITLEELARRVSFPAYVVKEAARSGDIRVRMWNGELFVPKDEVERLESEGYQILQQYNEETDFAVFLHGRQMDEALNGPRLARIGVANG